MAAGHGHSSTRSDLFSWAKERARDSRSRARPQRSGFAAALALILEHGPRAQAPAPERRVQLACCPRCGRQGSVSRDFGTRKVNGELRPQSWCRTCRSARAKARADETAPTVLELDFGTTTH